MDRQSFHGKMAHNDEIHRQNEEHTRKLHHPHRKQGEWRYKCGICGNIERQPDYCSMCNSTGLKEMK